MIILEVSDARVIDNASDTINDVSLSVRNALQNIEPGRKVRISLIDRSLESSTGIQQDFPIEEWPILPFLKGVGIESLEFHTKDDAIVSQWADRITRYEQIFIEDPENFSVDEYLWDEIDPEADKLLIRCAFGEKHSRHDRLKAGMAFVPPMKASLGVDAQAVNKFLSEIEEQNAATTLLRIQSILKEYHSNAQQKDAESWASLLGDIIAIALECHELDKAVQIAEQHRESLSPLWAQEDRTQRLFKSYDPKASELVTWTRIFDSCDTPQLTHYLNTILGTEAGPQIIKLMNFRAQERPDEMIELCFTASENTQKLLLQWLTPHWRPKHYHRILSTLDTLYREKKSLELFRFWLLALLRSSRATALQDLIQYFPKRRIFGRQDPDLILYQRTILHILTENPTSESFHFLMQIKKNVEGELADQVGKLLSLYPRHGDAE